MTGIAFWESLVQLSEQERQERAAMQEEMKARALPVGAMGSSLNRCLGRLEG